MRKNSRLKVPVTVSLDYEYLKEFEQHSKGRLSETINAVLQEEFEKQKNEQALDVLNLGSLKNGGEETCNHTRQSTLFEAFSRETVTKDTIVKFIHSVDDPKALGELASKAKCMWKTAENRRWNLTHKVMM